MLDPSQIEERERRRLKQLEQQVGTSPGRRRFRLSKMFQRLFAFPQRAIEAQVEERRLQRERDEARRRKEEEEEERRLASEREMLERRYELDTLKERQKVRMHAHTRTHGHGTSLPTLTELLPFSRVIRPSS